MATPSVALMPVRSLAQMEQDVRNVNANKQSDPLIQELAGHVKRRWEEAKDARTDVDERMVDNLLRRRGEYDSQKLQEIKQFGGSEMWLGITSVKCRAAASWLRETLTGTGLDRPWTLETTPVPDVPPDVVQSLAQNVQAQLTQQLLAGVPVDQNVLQEQVRALRDNARNEINEEARRRVERMASKIEDLLVEGGWLRALDEFIDDLVTFPTAIIKGPVPRMRKQLAWVNGELVPQDAIRLEWERVDPFMIYPAPWSSYVDDGYLIERHRLTRDDLQAMIGVEGYDSDAISAVLADFTSGGLREWLWSDAAKADAEGKDEANEATTELIDALQLWDSVEGRKLIEWGMSEEDVPDPYKSYPCELWLVGNTVIRAVLNYEPLGRKPYYATSYEKIPGAFWGNSVVDLVRDPQDMCNSAARSLANNMGISSGPQVMVNVSRLADGEQITKMYPWKIWQTAYRDFTDASAPITFFQPTSNAAELLTVLDKFAALADEYSGIPKYMTGEHVAGAGRTSSGLAMLINNAAKALKHVVSNVDVDVINPMLERVYQHQARYNPDPDMIGDVRVVARGAMSLVSREAAAVRRNEFLQILLSSPVAADIAGKLGVAELLRENARLLDVNPDKIVPSRDALEQRIQQEQMMLRVMAENGMLPEQQGQGSPKKLGAPTQPDGSREGGRDMNTQSPRPNLK